MYSNIYIILIKSDKYIYIYISDFIKIKNVFNKKIQLKNHDFFQSCPLHYSPVFVLLSLESVVFALSTGFSFGRYVFALLSRYFTSRSSSAILRAMSSIR